MSKKNRKGNLETIDALEDLLHKAIVYARNHQKYYERGFQEDAAYAEENLDDTVRYFENLLVDLREYV